MIIKVVNYFASCDFCETTLQRGFETKKELREVLKEIDWRIRKDRRIVCKDCIVYDSK
jgi:hypothetical protein